MSEFSQLPGPSLEENEQQQEQQQQGKRKHRAKRKPGGASPSQSPGQNPLMVDGAREATVGFITPKNTDVEPVTVVVTDELTDGIERCIRRLDTAGTGVIEVHTLKRVMHAAKLAPDQKDHVLPPKERRASATTVTVDECVAALNELKAKDHGECQSIMIALNSVPVNIVGDSNGGSKSFAERLASLVENKRALLADNNFKRIWDSFHLITILFFYITFLIKNVLFEEYDYEGGSGGVTILVLFIVVHVFWLLDIFQTCVLFTIDADGRLVRKISDIILERRYVLVVDCLAVLPFDFIFEAADLFVPFLLFRLLKLFKVFRISWVYEIVNRDIITPSVVTFYFQYKTILTGLCWLVVFLHSCAVIHNLIADDEVLEDGTLKEPTYMYSLVTCATFLSGANSQARANSTQEMIFCIPLAVLSLFFQGILVGKLTAVVFRNSVSSENYELMRDTLNIVRHYKVPNSIQREVLSYQMHALNDDVARHMRHLEALPHQMRADIMLYVKIDAISRVKMFSGASEEVRMKLASTLKLLFVQPEAEVVRVGEIGDKMYMVVHGYADVILASGKIVTTFTRGDCFGEMALVQKDSRRTATVRALTYCEMWSLAKDNFLEALATSQPFFDSIEAELQKRNANINELKVAVEEKKEALGKGGAGATAKKSVENASEADRMAGEEVLLSPTEGTGTIDVNLQHGLVRNEHALRRSSLFRVPSVHRQMARAASLRAIRRRSTAKSEKLSSFAQPPPASATAGGEPPQAPTAAQQQQQPLQRPSRSGGGGGTNTPPNRQSPTALRRAVDHQLEKLDGDIAAARQTMQSVKKKAAQLRGMALQQQQQPHGGGGGGGGSE